MAILDEFSFEPMVGDPDDHRPDSVWTFVFDPPTADGAYVRDLTMLFERIAPGDRIPLHSHTTSEAVFVDRGEGLYTLGEETRAVGPGSVVFIPAGTPHGTLNSGRDAMHIRAVYPSQTIDITALERNPAPGTEEDPPRPPYVFDPRSQQA
ncbi:MAG TPA: cupin domain-containing protein [Actinomycetota bacterium]